MLKIIPNQGDTSTKTLFGEMDLLYPGNNGSVFDQVTSNKTIRMTGFGRLYRGKEVDWGFKLFKQYGDRNQKLDLAENLPLVAKSLGIKEIIAPSPNFGRGVAKKSFLTARIPLENGPAKVDLLRGFTADICVLEPGETFGISAAGCIVSWAHYRGNPEKNLPEKVVVSHLGLKCLLDYNMVTSDIEVKPTHLNPSVVDVVMNELGNLDADERKNRVHVGLGFPISAKQFDHPWDHPEYGRQNELLCNYLVKHWGETCVVGWNDPKKRALGRIDIGYLAREQFKAKGVDREHVSSTPCFDRYPDDTGLPLWYNTRGEFGKDKRNLVLITRLK